MEHYPRIYQKCGLLQNLKQNLKYIYQEMFQLILILNILVFFKVLQYLIIDFHALHFSIFKFYN